MYLNCNPVIQLIVFDIRYRKGSNSLFFTFHFDFFHILCYFQMCRFFLKSFEIGHGHWTQSKEYPNKLEYISGINWENTVVRFGQPWLKDEKETTIATYFTVCPKMQSLFYLHRSSTFPNY